jgi:hypothetical protein
MMCKTEVLTMKDITLKLIAPLFRWYVRRRKAETYTGTLARAYRWYRRRLEGCRCSDGSDYSVYYKRGSVNKLVVYFSGGGLSWDEYTAARANTLENLLAGAEGYYFPNLPDYLDILLSGILGEKRDARNPVTDWNFLYIPYATADMHIGDSDFPYTDENGKPAVLLHHGARNVKAALDTLPSEFSEPEALLIAGESAGGFGCVAHAPAVAARFPGCGKITVYSDGAQIKAPEGFWLKIMRDVWNADEKYWSKAGQDGQLIRDWFRQAREELGDKALLLHSNSRFDETVSAFQNKIVNGDYSIGGNALTEFFQGLRAATESLSSELSSYYYYICNHEYKPEAGTTAHTTSRWPKRFYKDTVDGITLSRWLSDAVEGRELKNIGKDFLRIDE